MIIRSYKIGVFAVYYYASIYYRDVCSHDDEMVQPMFEMTGVSTGNALISTGFAFLLVFYTGNAFSRWWEVIIYLALACP